ncbi:MAG: SGNH/GDSL hydrolase family protein [Leptospirales bacterium]|nr:SGNH/GDSL hydrolase family protein [Leptospirales bacterium]
MKASLRGPALITLAGTLLLLALGETAARLSSEPELLFQRRQRQLHYYDTKIRAVLLRPLQNIALYNPDGFSFTVVTDARGERDAYWPRFPSPAGDTPEIWLIGDSIMMGYGVDQRDHFAALLADTIGDYRIRNLAVDSLGARSIYRLLQRELELSPTTPQLVVWNFHASDFLDDPRDLVQTQSARSSWRAWLIYEAQHYSALLLWLRLQLAPPEENQLAAYEEEQKVADAHPTLLAIDQICALLRRRGAPLLFFTYPEIDRRSGLPGDGGVLKRQASERAAQGGAVILDLQAAFQQYGDGKSLYLPVDGHPSAAAQTLMLLHVGPEIRRLASFRRQS